ncbi:MAG: transposase [Paludibacter sp.]
MSTKLGKKSESPIFKQILDLIPHSLLRASINKYKSDKSCSSYFTYDELVSMMFGKAKGGIKAHVSLDERSMIPEIINISEAKVSDRRGVDNFRYEKDTIIVDDRGYFDTKLFKIWIEDENHFITRIKGNILYESIRHYTSYKYLIY